MNKVGLNGDFLDFPGAGDDLRFQNVSLAISEVLLEGLGKLFINLVGRMKHRLMLPDQFRFLPADQFGSRTVTVYDHARFRLSDKYAVSGFFEQFSVPLFTLPQCLCSICKLLKIFSLSFSIS